MEQKTPFGLKTYNRCCDTDPDSRPQKKGECVIGQFSVSVLINRSEQEVFDFLSDTANI